MRGIDLPADDLTVSPGQIEHPIGEVAIAVFVDQPLAGGTALADAGHHVDHGRLPRADCDAAADRHNRIEHRTL